MIRRLHQQTGLGCKCFVIFPLILAYFWQPTHQITSQNFERIQIGMPYSDVKRILGSAPGDFGPGLAWPSQPFGVTICGTHRAWTVNEIYIVVVFDPSERVIQKDISERVIFEEAESFLDRLFRTKK